MRTWGEGLIVVSDLYKYAREEEMGANTMFPPCCSCREFADLAGGFGAETETYSSRERELGGNACHCKEGL